MIPLLGAVCLLGCAPQMSHVTKLSDMRQSPYCVLVVVDALGPDVFQILLNDGDIPNIKKHVVDRGMTARNMVSVFPSLTAAAITSIFTGVYPGRHQIPNFSWVDRKSGEYRSYIGTDIADFEPDLYKNASTIFQYLPKEQSASFGFIQGSQAGKDDSLMFSALNPFREMAPLSHIFLSDLFSKVGMGQGVPHLLAYYDWEVDVQGHRKGRFSSEVRQVMRRVDQEFGNIVKAYQERGLYDRTYFILASDHGLGEVRENIYIDQAFHNAGFKRKLISYNLGESLFPTTWARADSIWFTQEKVFRYNAVIGAAGGGCAAIDLVMNGGLDKNGNPDPGLWKEQPVYDELLRYDLGKGALVKERYVNVIRFVRDMKPVDFFIVRENRQALGEAAKVLIVSKEGLARVTRRQSAGGTPEYSYEVVKGKDPLGYEEEQGINRLVQSGFHDGPAWLVATAHHAYPHAPVLVASAMDTPRSGTLLVSMKPRWSVNSAIVEKHAGYTRDEMIATFCISGPGLSRGEFYTANIVDITPTILALLGDEPRPASFDGRPIAEIMEMARRRD